MFFQGNIDKIPYRRDIYELLNRASSLIVRVAEARRLAQEFLIILPANLKLRIIRARSVFHTHWPCLKPFENV